MGWFDSKAKVPNTISKREMEDLQRRAGKANPWFSKKAVEQTKAQERQRGKSRWS